VFVGKPDSIAAVGEELDGRGFQVDHLVREGRLVILDAECALAAMQLDAAIASPALPGEAAPPNGGAVLIEKAAEAAGGWLLGARATKLDGYLRALRAELDPRGIMNPGTLA
jgi:FAD/FMN-containing dehydrogenase